MRPSLQSSVFSSGRPVGSGPRMSLRDYLGLVGCVILMVALPASLTAENTLSEKSPFLPPGYGEEAPKPPPPPPPTQGPISRQLEFRGIVQIAGSYQFSLFSKKENKGYWIEENGEVSGINVRNYDADSGTIVVTTNGRSERLTLISATDSPLPVAQSTAKPQAPQVPNILPTPENIRPNTNDNNTSRRRVVPRRRVILPKAD